MPSASVFATSFDYSTIDIGIADEVREAAWFIRQCYQRHMDAVYRIGQVLLGIKEKLGHGNWGPWLATEFNWSIDTAENYMRVARVFDEKGFRTVRNLRPTTLYRLASPSIPESTRADIVERLATGEIAGDGEVIERVTELKRAGRQAGASDKRDKGEINATEAASLLVNRLADDEVDRLLVLLRQTTVLTLIDAVSRLRRGTVH